MRIVTVLFLVATLINYAWEIAQAPLFIGMRDWKNVGWHCFIASLGDGIILLVIYATGCIVFRRRDWFFSLRSQEYAVMLLAGLTIALLVEWLALHVLGRWAYTSSMPLIPGLNIGVTPILQMLILPPVIFRIVAIWLSARRAKHFVKND